MFGSIRSSAITASWTENGNPAGVTYYCEAPAGAGGSGWTGTLSFTSRSLTPDTVYSFRAKARNSDLIETGWVDLGSQTTKGVSAFASIIADGIDLLNGDIIRNKPALEIRTVSVSDITVSTFKIWIDDIQINDGSAVPGGYDSISASGKDIKFYYSPKTAITAGVHKIKAEVYDDEGTIFREQRTDLKIKTDKGITGAVLFYPNPIDPLKSTGRIAYTLNIDTDMTLFIFDTSGKIVWKYDCPAGLMGGKAGYNEVEWSGNDFSDRKLLNDVYLLRVVEKDTGSVLGKAKIVILRSSAFKLDINSLAGIIGLALFGLVGAGSVMGFRKFISPRKK